EQPTLNSSVTVGSNVTSGTTVMKVTNSGLIPNSAGVGSTLGEWGMGVSFLSSKNIEIGSINASGFWGDGVYFGKNTAIEPNINIKIDTINTSNNRRQGVSVEHIDGLFINNIHVEDIKG